MINKRLYRLEFNEVKQCWHYDNFTHNENSNGWKTICESGLDNDFKPFTYSLDLILIEKKMSTKEIIDLWEFYLSVLKHQKIFKK